MTARMDYKNVTCVLTDASVLSRAAALVPFAVAPSSQYVIFPGFCDVHVHFREPGFSYKETMLSGSAAAVRLEVSSNEYRNKKHSRTHSYLSVRITSARRCKQHDCPRYRSIRGKASGACLL